MTFWKEMLTFVTGSTMLVGALGWMSRSIILHLLTRDVENDKGTLKAENDKDIERLRNELRLNAYEHELKFRILHEKQAEAAAEINARIQTLYEKIYSLPQIYEPAAEPSKAVKLSEPRQAPRCFNDYFYPHKIYLPRDVAQQTDVFVRKVSEVANRFGRGLTRKQVAPLDHEDEDPWTQALDEMEKKVTPRLNLLLDESPRLIGFPMESDQATIHPSQSSPNNHLLTIKTDPHE